MALELNGTTGVSLVQDGVVTSDNMFSGFANGITVAQQFRLAADQAGSGSAGTVLTNWEENDTDYQSLGSAWTQSSGVFSVTETGIYLCNWSLVVNGTTTDDGFDPAIEVSTNSGSSYADRSYGYAHVSSVAGTLRGTVANTFIFHVSNASIFRLRFKQSFSNALDTATTIAGNSNSNETQITFVRLGG